MKKVLFSLVGITWYLTILSQSLSIELSTHRQLKEDVFNEDSIISTPFLNITYRNNGDESIYLKKVSLPKETGFPRTNSFHMLHFFSGEDRLNLRKRAEVSISVANEYMADSYKVNIGDSHSRSGGWLIINESEPKDGESDIINHNITEIHTYIYEKKQPNPVYSHYYFEKDEITEEGILNISRENFVFLKPNETYIDTFNLVAFQYTKANFTFEIKTDIVSDSVYTEGGTWNDSLKKNIVPFGKLPEKVGEYHLYKGCFHTNGIKLNFTPVQGVVEGE